MRKTVKEGRSSGGVRPGAGLLAAAFALLPPTYAAPDEMRLPPNIDCNLGAYYRGWSQEASTSESATREKGTPEKATSGESLPAKTIRVRSAADAPDAHPPSAAGSPTVHRLVEELMMFRSRGRPMVYISTRGSPESVSAELQALGVEIYQRDEANGLIEASLPIEDLPQVATLEGVLAVRPVYRPLSRSGAVQTQGDAVLRGPEVRSHGYDGSPFLVGTMSHSGIAPSMSQPTGDLPPEVEEYLSFCEEMSDGEGRAMLEVIHDIAPGSRLAHYSLVFGGPLSFAEGIRIMADAGSRVIVDDNLFPDEPFFQDGPVAQTIDELAVGGGVAYFTAAGNDADQSYEAPFRPQTPAGAKLALHYFDASGDGVDTLQSLTLPSGTPVILILQWDDPWFSVDGVTHDFNVRVRFPDAEPGVISAESDNLGTQMPVEILGWQYEGEGSHQAELEIERAAGEGSSLLKYVLLTNGRPATIEEHATRSGTIFGHAAARGADTIGAVPWFAPEAIEPFSSRGEVSIMFDPRGNRLPVPEVRCKPDLVAPDQVNTTFFGGDIPEDDDVFPNFPGTSAAASHAAGVAALILDVAPDLTPAALRDILATSAVDLGPEGQDCLYGWGRVDAEAARQEALARRDGIPPTARLLSPRPLHGWSVDRVEVVFTEDIQEAGALDPTSYTLVEAGADGQLGTGDDASYAVAVEHDAEAASTRILPTHPAPFLDWGKYRLTLSASQLRDRAGNPLGGGTDQVLEFTIAPFSPVITLSQGLRSAVRGDGVGFVADQHNPELLSRYRPQIRLARLLPGGEWDEPFRSVPTRICEDVIGEDPTALDIAVGKEQGVVVYGYLIHIPNWIVAWSWDFQLLDREGRGGLTKYIDGDTDYGANLIAVDMNEAGSFAVTYIAESFLDCIVMGKVFGADGSVLKSFRVSEGSIGINVWGVYPQVSIGPDGTTVFTWHRVPSHNSDCSGSAVWARRFDPEGNALGGAFLVNETVRGDQGGSRVASGPDGSYAIVWNGPILSETAAQGPTGVFFRRYRGSTPLGSEVLLSAGTSPALDVAPDGRFVIVWQDGDGDGTGIFAQRFLADGSPFGRCLWINDDPAGNQTGPQVGMRDSGDFLVTWQDDALGYRARWISWEAPEVAIPVGPRVLGVRPVGADAAPFDKVEVRFQQPIDAGTFTTDRAEFVDPFGRPVNILSVASDDARTFVLSFPPQKARGDYQVRIKSGVVDTAGRSIDQDGDGTSEPFQGGFYRRPVPGAFPLEEGFELQSVDAIPLSWAFSPGAGSFAVTQEPCGPDGTRRLQLEQDTPDMQAIVAVDLSQAAGRTDLGFAFRLGRADDDFHNHLSVLLSNDLRCWRPLVSEVKAPVDRCRQFSWDLDRLVSDLGLQMVAPVYFAFRQNDRATFLDDVRVTAQDIYGPRVIAQEPSGFALSPLDHVKVTFNEAIDPASFTAGDVKIVEPLGGTTGALSVETEDNLTWTIRFQPRARGGVYQVIVGPDISDLRQNAMNQDEDFTLGGDGDAYVAVVELSPERPATLPYVEGFEACDAAALSAWSFDARLGSIAVTTRRDPLSGSCHLEFVGKPEYGVTTTRSAVLAVDLAGIEAPRSLALQFWMKLNNGDGRTDTHRLEVYLSGDGRTYASLGKPLIPQLARYVQFTFDLGAAMEELQVAATNTLYMRFVHAASNAYATYVDDLSVVSGERFFYRGDTNADAAVNLTDGVFLLRHLFQGGAAPPCAKGADADDDAQLTITDAIYILNHLFLGGPEPAAPFTGCGLDFTPDGLTCEDFPPCQER